MIFFLLFLVVPLIEIGIFIAIGDRIGIFTTLLLCVVTAVIGAALIRHQGLQIFLSARKALDRGEMPLGALFDGLCLGVAGALLMTPGFFTDAMGFSLLFPGVRRQLRRALGARFAGYAEADAGIIEGEFIRLEDPPFNDPPSDDPRRRKPPVDWP